MTEYLPSTYGDRIAGQYDVMHPPIEQAAIDLLAELASGGPVLEMGIGTGRIALPLASRGLWIHSWSACRPKGCNCTRSGCAMPGPRSSISWPASPASHSKTAGRTGRVKRLAQRAIRTCPCIAGESKSAAPPERRPRLTPPPARCKRPAFWLPGPSPRPRKAGLSSVRRRRWR